MTILDTIVKKKMEEITIAKANVSVMHLEESEYFYNETSSLRDFILDPERTGIIAEFKRRSPSKGIINNISSLGTVPKGYADAGA